MRVSAETHTQLLHRNSVAPINLTRKLRVSEQSNAKADLVVRAQRGDATAYGQLYQHYHPYICKIVNEEVADRDVRHDIVQTVFERGWSKLDTLRDPKAFKAWMAQLARRQIIDHYRRSSRTVATDFNDPAEGHDIADDDWSSHDWAAMRELAEALRVGIDGLSKRDATVLELATSFGFNSQEIAAALDIDTSHARVLLHRARKRLSAALVSNYDDALT